MPKLNLSGVAEQYSLSTNKCIYDFFSGNVHIFTIPFFISRHLSLDSSVMSVRRDAEEALQKELNFAAHLGLPAVMVSLTVLLIIHKNWKSTEDTTEKFVEIL